VQKWGKKYGKQNYKCQECGHSFQNEGRGKKGLEYWMSWYKKYARDQRTLEDISQEIGMSKRNLQRKFDTLSVFTGEVPVVEAGTSIVVTMDATSIGKDQMLTLLRDTKKKNLYWSWSKTEKVEHYEKCLKSLLLLGYSFSAFVIDGRKGVRKMLEREYPNVPIQQCQKHQIEVVKRLIPERAKTQAAKSLRSIATRISLSLELQISTALEIWQVLNGELLNEKTFHTHPTTRRKWWYTHKNIRSAFFSLKRNLPYIFTCQKHPNIRIPNTTNICDGYFSHLKDRINRHRGLSPHRKFKITNFLLENF